MSDRAAKGVGFVRVEFDRRGELRLRRGEIALVSKQVGQDPATAGIVGIDRNGLARQLQGDAAARTCRPAAMDPSHQWFMASQR